MYSTKIIIEYRDNSTETYHGTLIIESDAFFQIVTSDNETKTFPWATIKNVTEH